MRLTVSPSFSIKLAQTLEVNWVTQSLTMSSGIPKYPNVWVNMNSAVLKVVGRLGRGIKCRDFENLSLMTNITVLPSQGGQ